MAWDMHLLQTRKYKKKTFISHFYFIKQSEFLNIYNKWEKIITIHVCNNSSSSRISSTLSVIKLYSDIKKI
jgi:hypothetical protein